MRKLKIATISCLTLIILWLGWVYSKNYRLAYEFNKNRWAYETMVKFTFDNGVKFLDRRSCYVFGAFGNMMFNTEPCSSLKYSSSENGAFNRDCDKICNIWNGITVDSLMVQIRAYDIHSKNHTTPFDSLFFWIFDWDRTIGYKKDGWWDIKKWQTTYGGTFEYRIDDNWIILKDYDRDRNPKPEKYDF